MEDEWRPPDPTEETLTNMITRVLEFPDGCVVSMKMSEWHWQMVAFYDKFKEQTGYLHGIVYQWHTRCPDSDDDIFSKAMMLNIRDDYYKRKLDRKRWI
jgi:hypothetical protein